MSDVFISYSSHDSDIAQKVHSSLTLAGVDTFLAEISIKSGEKWKQSIIDNMNSSQWVILLMSQKAKESMAVSHEIGAAIFQRKNLYPIIWDMSPEEMPEWIQDRQAIDISSGDPDTLHELIESICSQITIKKTIITLFILAICAFVFYKSCKR